MLVSIDLFVVLIFPLAHRFRGIRLPAFAFLSHALPLVWRFPSDKASCFCVFILLNKKAENIDNSTFSALVPATGIEPVRGISPAGF